MNASHLSLECTWKVISVSVHIYCIFCLFSHSVQLQVLYTYSNCEISEVIYCRKRFVCLTFAIYILLSDGRKWDCEPINRIFLHGIISLHALSGVHLFMPLVFFPNFFKFPPLIEHQEFWWQKSFDRTVVPTMGMLKILSVILPF